MKLSPYLLVFSSLFIGIGSVLALLGWLPTQAQAVALPPSCCFAAPQPPALAGLGSLIWPISGSSTQPDTDSVSSPFGPRWQASKSRNDYHPGIDIAAALDTPVHVITDGVAAKVGWLSADSGLTVIVHHPSLGLSSAYLHLNSAAVSVGQAVTRGQVIGAVGNSGTTEFMHLHFEIRLDSLSYPGSTRNPMGYLPRPEVTTPTLKISALQSSPIYSPTITLTITTTRQELDLNQIRVILQDRATHALLDDQMVDFNQRLHTGGDTLDQDGIRLTPGHFNTATSKYSLTAEFYQLHGYDSFTITAQVTDLSGNIRSLTAGAIDATPPGEVTTLNARLRKDGSVDLSWVAPGDSGPVGTAVAYEIRYAGQPVDSLIWEAGAIALPRPPIPVPGGRMQAWSLPGPFPYPVYFALRAYDDEGNRSQLSNSARALWTNFFPISLKH